MNPLWYKNAVIYSLDVDSFMDSDNDGVGDFRGLKHKLPYLASLGVSCVWLLPFYKSPNKDNGYDVKDYYQIDSRFGDLGNFVEVVDEAEELGIRILVDLVVNHTSIEHQWFQEARKSKDSPFHDFYIWRDEKPEKEEDDNIFGGSVWKYDDEAGAYYYHTFYPFQPDLNIANPAVQNEIQRIMHFWLKLGISGFRLDAAPHMVRQKGNQKFDGDPHEVFKNFRRFIEFQRRDAILLAEVDVEPDKYQDFFGKEDQMHMLFNFYVNNYIFLALAREEAAPLEKALENLPHNSEREQMANFIRNHDELDLERLTDKEREEVFKKFAPKEDMKIFGRGIRRRFPPMIDGHREKMELAYSLLFTLPGTPVLRYGQEIGMGDDLSLEGRKSVRTIMQWTDGKNAGFSKAPEDKLLKKVISEGKFGYKNLNVTDQHRDPKSLLNWMERAINFRKESPEFGWGKYKILKTGNKKVLGHSRESERGLGIALHNFSDKEETVKLNLEEPKDIFDVFGDKNYDKFDPETQEVKLSPFGYRWMRKRKEFL